MSQSQQAGAFPVQDPDVKSVKPVALVEIARSGMDVQIETARKYPRSIDTFVRNLRSEALMNGAVARTMFYAKPKKKNDPDPIMGPSARFAESVGRNWGNVRVESQMGEVGRKTVRAWGVAWDLETNYAIRVEVARGITDRKGNRYSDSLIVTTAMAAQSIARRNAILNVSTALFWRPVYEEAVRLSTGEDGTRSTTSIIKAELEAWLMLGVREPEVLKIANAEGKADLLGRKLAYLQGVRTAIEEGELTVNDVLFPEKAASGSADLNAVLDEMEEPA